MSDHSAPLGCKHCSRLVQVPALLSRSTTLTTNPFFALRDSYITTNSSLHTRSDFSDELCGTTAASIMVSGTTL